MATLSGYTARAVCGCGWTPSASREWLRPRAKRSTLGTDDGLGAGWFPVR